MIDPFFTHRFEEGVLNIFLDGIYFVQKMKKLIYFKFSIFNIVTKNIQAEIRLMVDTRKTEISLEYVNRID